MMPLATIDIGTNSVLLLVADWQGGRLEVLADEAQITRLGEGLYEAQTFLPEAERRTLSVLREYKKRCDAAGVSKILAVGTAAFRKAKNAADFVARVERETGIPIRTITGDEEARLSYLSVRHDFGDRPHLCALDIGGGSTEIIGENGGVSLELGTVVLTERLIHHDPPTPEELTALRQAIVLGLVIDEKTPVSIIKKLRGHPSKRPGLSGPVTLVGLAGTVTTLSSVHQRLKRWDPAKIQGSVLTTTDLEKLAAIFCRTTLAEKKRLPGMIAGREDTILAGTLILQRVMERLGTDRVIVSDRGLRFGLFYKNSQPGQAV